MAFNKQRGMKKRNQPARPWQPEIREIVSCRLYQVQSEADPKIFYDVDLAIPGCSCPHFGYRHQECKHMMAVRALTKKVNETPMTKEQTEILEKLADAAARTMAFAEKAAAAGCTIAAKDLNSIAKQL